MVSPDNRNIAPSYPASFNTFWTASALSLVIPRGCASDRVLPSGNMPFSIIAPSKDWIRENCVVTEEGEKWIERLPGPYTLIFKQKNHDCVAHNLAPGLETIGVRIPKHWISNFVKLTGVPIVTTSANVTGDDFMVSLKNLNIDIKNSVDLIIYEGEKKGKPSSIIDLTKEKIEVVER